MKIIKNLTIALCILFLMPSNTFAEETEQDSLDLLQNEINTYLYSYLEDHNANDISELLDVEKEAVLDHIEDIKGNYYGTTASNVIQPNYLNPLSSYTGGVFIQFDSSTAFGGCFTYEHGHAAIGNGVGTIEIRGPGYTVSSYGSGRIAEWYQRNSGGYYTMTSATNFDKQMAAQYAANYIGRPYFTVNPVTGMSCVSVVTGAWYLAGYSLNAVTPTQLAACSQLVRQFSWADVEYPITY